MVKQYNIDAFLKYNYVPFSKKQCFMRILLVWGISLFAGLLGVNNGAWLKVIFCANALISSRFFFLIFKESIKKNARFICDGVFYAYISVLLCVAAYRVMVLYIGDSWLLLITLLTLLIISNSLFMLIIFLHIKKGSYRKTSQTHKLILLPFVGGVAGMVVARLLLNNTTQETAITLIAIILLLLSFLTGIGSLNLLKVILSKQDRSE